MARWIWTVDPDTLRIAGTGEVAAIPATLGVEMDFRNGPPDQVLEHYTANGTGHAGGAGGGRVARGRADQRAGRGERGLCGAAQRHGHSRGRPGSGPGWRLPRRFGWSKAAGPAASASARLGLTRGRITSLDRLSAEGPGLSVASHAQIHAGQATMLVLDRVRLGKSEARGAIGLPRGCGRPAAC